MRARDLGPRARGARRTRQARHALRASYAREGPQGGPAGRGAGAAAGAVVPAVPFPRLSVAGLVYLRGRDADARLRALEAQRVGVRPVLGALAARLRQIRGWRALGFRNLADFARERLGLEARTVSEWARVWSALEELPALRGAVLAGEVSWTVARRVVAVATPETDAACLETVRGRTVRAVDALVAAWKAAKAQDEGAVPAPSGGETLGKEGDGGVPASSPGSGLAVGPVGPEDEDDDAERLPVRIGCPARVALKWDAAVELARRWSGEMLPAWGAADLIAAEVSSALPPEPGPAPWQRDEATGASRESAVPGDGASAAEADAWRAGGPTDPSAAGPGAMGATGNAAERAERAGAGARSRRRPRPDDPEPGPRHAAFPHVPWRPLRRTERDVEEARALDALAEGREGCGPHELDARLRAAVGFLQGLDLELGRILRQVLGRRLYRELGFESFERYVGERLDTSPRTARRLVRLARAEHTAPRVAAGFREGRLSAFQADAVLGALARGKDLPAEVLEGVVALRGEKPAASSRCPTLRAALAPDPGPPFGALPAPGADARWVALAERVSLRRLEREAEAQPANTPPAVAFHAPPEVAAFFGEMLERVRRRLGPEAPAWAALEAMLDHVIAAWVREGEQFRDYADFVRDEFWCTAPGCTSRSELESHHIVFRSAGGPDEPGNRTSLCWFHHHAGIHARGMRVAGRAPDRLFFELGMRRDGPPLARYRSGDVMVK